MKRLRVVLCGLLLVGLLCGLCTEGLAQPSSGLAIYGDLNGDEQINASDALLTLQHSVGLTILTDAQEGVADTSADGEIDAADALLVLQFSVALIRRFPIQDSSEVNQSMTNVEPSFAPGAEVYARAYQAVPVEGIRSTYQMGAGYSDRYAIPSDSVMAYVPQTTADSVDFLKKWQDANGKRKLCMMINSKNVANYITDFGGSEDEIQKDADGNLVGFAGMSYYMCPTEHYIDFVWELIDHHCSQVELEFIAIEEPDFPRQSGYSEAFKAEWKAYYGEDWVDPASSAEASYRASKLKTYLFARLFATLGQRLDEHYPDVKLIVATHSTPSYNRNGLVPGLNQYADLAQVDGVIGQTWSNTVAVPIPYAGGEAVRQFESAYLGYASFVDALRGDQLFYALSDPYADFGTSDWDYYESTWKKTVAAQLMQPQVHRFQESIWLDRSFSSDTPGSYRTVQLSVFNALNDLSGDAVTVYGGTPGIAIGLSDSLGWQYGSEYMPTANTSSGFYGLTLPLVERGIPLGIVSLDQLSELEQLQGVRLLILSYDIMKPLDERCNQVLADFVKTGGCLLYIGGSDGFDALGSEWWGQKGETPLQNLISHLGVDITCRSLDRIDAMSWSGPSNFGASFEGQILMGGADLYSLAFDGGSAILKASDDAIGVEAQVGLGRFIAVGLPSSYFSSQTQGPQMLRELVEYAVGYTGLEYVESEYLAAQRGDYLVAQALTEDLTLTGDYVDIYDPKLPVVTSKTLTAGESGLLRELSALRALSTPVLAHHGATLLSEVTQTAQQTQFTFHTVAESTCAFRFLGNGSVPQAVTLRQGDVELIAIATWDTDSESLLVEMTSRNADPIEMTVDWGSSLGAGIFVE